MKKHSWNCKGNCRYNLQCALDAAWQTLEELLQYENEREEE